MRRLGRVFIGLLLLAAGLPLSTVALSQRNLVPAPASAQSERVALVIGNSAYKQSPLANPVNDATDMASALQGMGFKVILKRNAGTRDMRQAVRDFGAELRRAQVGLFYFAGHGVQVKGSNYLIPVGADIESEADAEDLAIDANYALRTMEESQVKVSIVILDACRNNPFARSFRSASRGLAQMTAATGSLVAFATAPGSVAADGTGRNGIYTKHLLASLKQGDTDILKVFQRTRAAVVKETGGKQTPWESTSLVGDFYFGPPPGSAQFAIAAPSTGSSLLMPAFDPAAVELALWESVKEAKTAEELKAYLDQYPSGRFAAVARIRLRALETPPDSPAAQVASAAPSQQQPAPGVQASDLEWLARGSVFRDCADCPELVVIPAGTFSMGDFSRRSVTIPQAFAVGKFQVTFAEWDACVTARACDHKPNDGGWGRGNQPVINVNWNDAKQYTTWLSKRTGKNYRLLSEAEWEYAARAGTRTAYFWGDSVADICRYLKVGKCGGPGPSPVGQRRPNAFGLYDITGNVTEWTEDCRNVSSNAAPSDGSAWTSGDCTNRVARGGTWRGAFESARVGGGVSYRTDSRYDILGFRVARAAAPAGSPTQAASVVSPPAPSATASTSPMQIASLAPSIAASRPQAPPGSIAAMTPGTSFKDCDVCPEMVVIPAGNFMMGSPDSERRRSDEGPQHSVTIAHPFAAGKYEVTFDEWEACVRERGCPQNPYDSGWGRGRRPVIAVSWHSAKAYVEWLSRKTARTYRLLTEAQWEYVARAGTTTAFAFGVTITPQQANYNTSASYAGSPVATTPRSTVPVGSYAPNAFGLHDMHGNAGEWTEDCWNGSYDGAPSDGSAWTSGVCSLRVLRGGSWVSDPEVLRSAMRLAYNAGAGNYYYGFRVARVD